MIGMSLYMIQIIISNEIQIEFTGSGLLFKLKVWQVRYLVVIFC